MRRSILSILLVVPAVSFAQQSAPSRTVSPGMTRSQVVAALGEPATARTASEYSYLFYPNACGRACGMNDLVILRGDSVVDAIFRSPGRHYTGVSSSPVPVRPRTSTQPKATRKRAATSKAAKDSAAAKSAKASEKTTTPAPKIKPPKEANDARPSIPVNPTPMKPAPSKTPATTKPGQPK
jgi:outer membrane protein assembly factor BamE (lipoprotein component of BamABCDE complex)